MRQRVPAFPQILKLPKSIYWTSLIFVLSILSIFLKALPIKVKKKSRIWFCRPWINLLFWSCEGSRIKIIFLWYKTYFYCPVTTDCNISLFAKRLVQVPLKMAIKSEKKTFIKYLRNLLRRLNSHVHFSELNLAFVSLHFL